MKLAAVAMVAAVTIWCAPAAAITGDELCRSMHWPMPLPPTVGW